MSHLHAHVNSLINSVSSGLKIPVRHSSEKENIFGIEKRI